MSQRIRSLLLAVIAAAGTGCSSDDTTGVNSGTARVAFIHAIADTGIVDVRVASRVNPTLTAVPYGSATAYQSVAGGLLVFTVQPSPSTAVGTPRAITNLSGVNIRDGASVTLVAAGEARDTVSTRAAGITPYVDDVSVPASGLARVRVINASPDAGAVDVYLTPQGAARPTTPTLAGIDYRSAVSYTTSAGSYVLTVTPLSDPVTVLTTASLTLPAGGVQTAVVRGIRGTLPSGLGTDRQIGVTTMVNVAP
jgi:hypothetical protein